jgi:hypothetical protein
MFLDKKKIEELAKSNGYTVNEIQEGIRFRNPGSTILITVKNEGTVANISVEFQTDIYHSVMLEHPKYVDSVRLLPILDSKMKQYVNYSKKQTMMG